MTPTKRIGGAPHGDEPGSRKTLVQRLIQRARAGRKSESVEEQAVAPRKTSYSVGFHPVYASPVAVATDDDGCIQRAYYLLARRGFPSDRALADAVGVHRSQVSRWSRGRLAQRENTWLLRDVATTVARLADHYDRTTVQKWLVASNPELGGEVPIEVLKQGRLPEILMAVDAQTSGAFA